MDAALFEVLLNEEEGNSLDFKRDQYRFVKASLEDKAELLKDLLGFANALRRADAYILVGVEDVRGSRGNVIGISEHLDDHSLQQFVAHNTNRTLHFHYEAFTFEGKNVGIIRIDIAQDRPLSLVRDMGQLKKGEVYLRRGSYTDPTKPATADEIALMGRASTVGLRRSELAVQFADVETGKPIGPSIAWEATELRTPPPSQIPSYSVRRSSFDVTLDRDNPDFYREVAEYAAFQSLFRPVRVVIQNIGSTPAEHVRVEIEVDPASGVSLKEYEPDEPARTRMMGVNSDVFRGIRRPVRDPGDVEIFESKKNARLVIECGNMQPGRRVPSDKFYVAVRESGPTSLSGLIFAATLEQPQSFAVTIDATISVADVPAEAIREFAEKHIG
jgi:Putative DNA-binding domain